MQPIFPCIHLSVATNSDSFLRDRESSLSACYSFLRDSFLGVKNRLGSARDISLSARISSLIARYILIVLGAVLLVIGTAP